MAGVEGVPGISVYGSYTSLWSRLLNAWTRQRAHNHAGRYCHQVFIHDTLVKMLIHATSIIHLNPEGLTTLHLLCEPSHYIAESQILNANAMTYRRCVRRIERRHVHCVSGTCRCSSAHMCPESVESRSAHRVKRQPTDLGVIHSHGSKDGSEPRDPPPCPSMPC